MINWRKTPFIRVLVPFIIGILFSSLYSIKGFHHNWFIIIALLLSFAFFIFSFSFQRRWVSGVMLNSFLFIFGYQLMLQKQAVYQQDHFQFSYQEKDWIIGTVNNQPITKNNIRFPLKVTALGPDQDQLKKAKGNILIQLPASPESNAIKYGDLLILKAPLRTIQDSKNPYAFNYKNYLARQHIFHQINPKATEWKSIAPNYEKSWLITAKEIQHSARERLRKYLPSENEFAIASALILGDKSGISDEVRTAFSQTGAMHVLAVSGLHVGFIASGLAWFLGFFRLYDKRWKVVRTIIILLSVWAYAFITGASPSVMRAATMFSFLIIGQAMHRNASIYNSLAASAFFLLLFNPLLLFEVGFQLSYLAVIGIVFFFQRIYKSWIIENTIGDFIWKMAAIGIAAQITTLPLSLFYFHQFPLYFWLSGIIIVPAAMLILPLGIAVIVLDLILPFLAGLIGNLLYGVVWISSAFIFLLHQIPGGLIEGVWIGGSTVLICYFLIAKLMVNIEWRQKKSVFDFGIATLVLMLFVKWAVFKINTQKQNKLTVYHVYKNSLIDIFQGNKSYRIASPSLSAKAESFAANNHRIASGIKTIDTLSFDLENYQSNYFFIKGNHLQAGNTKWALISKAPNSKTIPLVVDYILIKDNPNLKIAQIQKAYQFDMLILDASNSYKKREKWKKECKVLDIHCIDIVEEGSFSINLNQEL